MMSYKMSRRKQARPIRHLDDDGFEVNDADAPLGDAECDDGEQTEKNREPDGGDGAEDRVNNNEKRGRRRKRDDDGLSNEEDDEAEDSTDEAKKKKPGDENPLLRNHASISPSSPLFPYAATLANANITLDALQSTKMALAQMAANAMINKETQSPAALQEIAVLQSTLYALQQQQIMQLQLIQQLQQQLQINNLNEPPNAEVSAILNEANNVIQATRQSVTEEPELIEKRAKRDDVDLVEKPEPKTDTKEPRPKVEIEDAKLAEKPSTSSTSSPSLSTTTQPSDSWASNSYSSVSLMSQLASGSLADTILQSSEPPPNPEGPSTLDLLQRTAQQVLNNASQGLLATNLADELGFRNGANATGSSATETGPGGKKDQLFKHRCRYCGKVFSSDSALQIHIRSHTGERPFKCNICGNRFTTKGNLKVHFQRHAQRFPHVKMNPHPVPEHLDKFHPPLLAQLEMDESKVSPPPPIPPFSNPHHNFHLPLPPPPPQPSRSPSSSMQIRPNQPSSLFRAAPFLLRPGNPLMQPRPVFQPLVLKADDKELIKSEVKKEEEDAEETKVKTERPESVHEEAESRTLENEHDQGKRSNADLEDSSSVDSKFNTDYRSGDENIEESKSQKDLNSSVDLPENLCGRRSSSQSSADSSQPAQSDTSVVSANTTPNLHFPPYSGAAVPPNLNALMLLPGEFDPAKDPAIYTNLLPRPGSNDNAWESLIEVTRTSDTAKLQQLVDNIENKLVDPNQCVVCHRVLSCKSALQMHYRTHTGERPFKCKICGRAFTTKGNLKTHMGVHRAKPPARLLHICPVCHKKFTNGLVLQQHIRLHTGEPTDLTPEQIAAAELRDPYGHPGFPFLPSGFHPFLAHPTSFMAQNPAANFQAMPDNLSLSAKGDNNKEAGDSRDGEDLMIDGGSSSEAHSPTSSTTSTLLYQHSALLNLQFQHQLQQRLRDNPQGMSEEERQQFVAHLSRANAEFLKKYQQELAMDEDDDAEDEDDDDDEPSDDSDRKRDSSKSEDQAPEMNGRCSPPTTKDNAPVVKARSDNCPVSLNNRNVFSLNASPDIMPAFGATKPVASPRQIASPLDLTSNRPGNTIGSALFPPSVSTPSFANFLPPIPAASASSSTTSATTPASTSSSSALSSLTSAVMASPSFNPLNLPISAPGRGNTTCNICFKTFACHSALEIHYRSHTKERPFKCAICDRGFSTKGNMKQHMMTHKNRDGTPISLDLVNGMYSERGRGRAVMSLKESFNKADEIQHSKTEGPRFASAGGNSAAMISSATNPVQEHCLSLTIQHRSDRPVDAKLQLSEQDSRAPISETESRQSSSPVGGSKLPLIGKKRHKHENLSNSCLINS